MLPSSGSLAFWTSANSFYCFFWVGPNEYRTTIATAERNLPAFWAAFYLHAISLSLSCAVKSSKTYAKKLALFSYYGLSVCRTRFRRCFQSVPNATWLYNDVNRIYRVLRVRVCVCESVCLVVSSSAQRQKFTKITSKLALWIHLFVI